NLGTEILRSAGDVTVTVIGAWANAAGALDFTGTALWRDQSGLASFGAVTLAAAADVTLGTNVRVDSLIANAAAQMDIGGQTLSSAGSVTADAGNWTNDTGTLAFTATATLTDLDGAPGTASFGDVEVVGGTLSLATDATFARLTVTGGGIDLGT